MQFSKFATNEIYTFQIHNSWIKQLLKSAGFRTLVFHVFKSAIFKICQFSSFRRNTDPWQKGDFQPEATNKTCCHTERLTIERDGEVLYNILRMPMNDEHDDDHHEHDNEHRHTQVSFNLFWRSRPFLGRHFKRT